MKGLWTKDIRLISSQQKNLAVIWLVAAGILIATDQISFAITYTSVITIMTAISTISTIHLIMAMRFYLRFHLAEKNIQEKNICLASFGE